LHDFHEILAVAIGAVPCKGQGSVDMGLFAKAKEPFLRGFLKLENGVPSHATPELAEGQPAFPQARSGAVPGGVSAVHDGLQQNDSCQAGRRRRLAAIGKVECILETAAKTTS
jgi:hypothetical protein